MPNTDPAIIKLRNVRLSFPHLFHAHAMKEDQEAKFSAVFLMDNEQHAELIKQIRETIERLALDYWKKKMHPKICLRDGNEKPDFDGYGDGITFLSAARKTRPVVVDTDPSIPITEEDGKIYGGCYVNATVRLWVQDNKWGKRVNAELRAVQFYKDGESFGAGPVNAEEEFGDDPGTGSTGTRAKPSTNIDDY